MSLRSKASTNWYETLDCQNQPSQIKCLPKRSATSEDVSNHFKCYCDQGRTSLSSCRHVCCCRPQELVDFEFTSSSEENITNYNFSESESDSVNQNIYISNRNYNVRSSCDSVVIDEKCDKISNIPKADWHCLDSWLTWTRITYECYEEGELLYNKSLPSLSVIAKNADTDNKDSDANLDSLDLILRDLGEAISWLEPKKETEHEFSTSLLSIFDDFLRENKGIMSSTSRNLNENNFKNEEKIYKNTANLNLNLNITGLNKVPSYGNISMLSDDVFLTPRKDSFSSISNSVQYSSTEEDLVELRNKSTRSSKHCVSFDINLIFDHGDNLEKPIPPKRRKNKKITSLHEDHITKFSISDNISDNRSVVSCEEDYHPIWNCTSNHQVPEIKCHRASESEIPQVLKRYQFQDYLRFGEERVPSTYFESISDIPALVIDKPVAHKFQVREDRKHSEEKYPGYSSQGSAVLDYCTNNHLNMQFNYEKRKKLEASNHLRSYSECDMVKCSSQCDLEACGHCQTADHAISDEIIQIKNKYNDDNVNEFLNNFKTNNLTYFNNNNCKAVFGDVFLWKKMLLQPDFNEDEEDEWQQVDPELKNPESGTKILHVPYIRVEHESSSSSLENKPLTETSGQNLSRFSEKSDGSIENVELRGSGKSRKVVNSYTPPQTSFLHYNSSSAKRKTTAGDLFEEENIYSGMFKVKIIEKNKVGKSWKKYYLLLTKHSLHIYNVKDEEAFIAIRNDGKKKAELTLVLRNVNDVSCVLPSSSSKFERVYQLASSDPPARIHITHDDKEKITSMIQKICKETGLADQPSIAAEKLTPVAPPKLVRERTKILGSSENLNELEKKSATISKLKSFFVTRQGKDSLVKKGILKVNVFGGSLESLCTKESPRIPPFVTTCTRAIEKDPAFLIADGLYRASANLSQIQKLRLKIDQNNLMAVEEETDPHVLAGTLKLFFRELPKPLIPCENFTEFLEASNSVIKLRGLVQRLPECNRDTLHHLVKHLVKVTEKHLENRMDNSNLATVWGPTLMWPPEPEPSSPVKSSMTDSGPGSPNTVFNMAIHCVQQNRTVEALLSHHKDIFS